jgi:CRISPR type III-A-associated RAMP protein Csm4
MESFSISSAFPYIGNNLFFPKPLGRLNFNITGKDASQYRKSLKKVKFIEFSLWNDLICGQAIVATNERQISKPFLYDKYDKDTKIIDAYKAQVNQRVQVQRDEVGDASPFYFEWTYFDKRCGLFFITDAKGSLLDEVTSLFKELGENGIGTDRSVGGGHFSIEVSSIEIDEPNDSNARLLLSSYIPNKEEMPFLNLSESRYEISQRGGYIAGSNIEVLRHLRKRSIYMFNTGSVIKTDTPLIGKIVDLRPTWNDEKMHCVLRSGKALSIKIKDISL